MGDGGVGVALRAHDRQARREVRGQHPRQRSRGPRAAAASHTGIIQLAHAHGRVL